MKPRAPRHIITSLERALGYARLDTAGFGMPHDTVTVNGRPRGTVDAFIKEETRIHRESWIIPELEGALAWARGEK